MGFESETGGALDGALILDNELGIVAYAKRGLRLRGMDRHGLRPDADGREFYGAQRNGGQ